MNRHFVEKKAQACELKMTWYKKECELSLNLYFFSQVMFPQSRAVNSQIDAAAASGSFHFILMLALYCCLILFR